MKMNVLRELILFRKIFDDVLSTGIYKYALRYIFHINMLVILESSHYLHPVFLFIKQCLFNNC